MNAKLLNKFKTIEHSCCNSCSYLVTPLMGADLNSVGKVQRLSDDHVQFLIYQVLRGLKVCYFMSENPHFIRRESYLFLLSRKPAKPDYLLHFLMHKMASLSISCFLCASFLCKHNELHSK